MTFGTLVTLTDPYTAVGDRGGTYPAGSVFVFGGRLHSLPASLGEVAAALDHADRTRTRNAARVEPADPLAVVHTTTADRSRLVFPLRLLRVDDPDRDDGDDPGGGPVGRADA